MTIIFEDKKLERLAEDYVLSVRKLGTLRAELFQLRINTLEQADSLDDVRDKPGRFHQLMGDRKGQWACDLDHPYRLIFEPAQRPVPTDSSGHPLLNLVKVVGIIEITNYHGK